LAEQMCGQGKLSKGVGILSICIPLRTVKCLSR